MERYDTNQQNTRKFRLITQTYGTFEFITFGALERAFSTAQLADGSEMSTGLISVTETESTFYFADRADAVRMELWHRRSEEAADGYIQRCTQELLLADNQIGGVIEVERMFPKTMTYPEGDRSGDGEAGTCSVTFSTYRPTRLDTVTPG